MNNLEPVEICLQSLGLLFIACEPLTYDCDRTKEESELLDKDIERHAYYCGDVKRDMKNGRMPKTWDEWNDEQKSYVVEEPVTHLEPIDTREFGNLLTNIFNG